MAEHFEVFMFNDAGIGNICFCVIDDSISLIVSSVVNFLFKTNSTILQLSETGFVIFVYLSCKNNFIGNIFPIGPIVKKIRGDFCFNSNK